MSSDEDEARKRLLAGQRDGSEDPTQRLLNKDKITGMRPLLAVRDHTLIEDLPEAFYAEVEQVQLMPFFTRIFVGLCSPIAPAIVLANYCIRFRSWRLGLHSFDEKGYTNLPYFLAGFWYVGLFLYLAGYTKGVEGESSEVERTELGVPFLFLLTHLIYASASHGAKSVEAQTIGLGQDTKMMMRIANGLQSHVSNTSLAQETAAACNADIAKVTKGDVLGLEVAVDEAMRSVFLDANQKVSMHEMVTLFDFSQFLYKMGSVLARLPVALRRKVFILRARKVLSQAQIPEKELWRLMYEVARVRIRAAPEDRTTFRRLERLKTSNYELAVAEEHLVKFDRRDYKPGSLVKAYEDQFETGSVKLDVAAEQILIGMSYSRSMVEKVMSVFEAFFWLLAVGLVIYGSLLPNYFRQGKILEFSWPQSNAATYITFVWLLFTLTCGLFVLFVVPRALGDRFQRLHIMHAAMIAMLSPPTARSRYLPYVNAFKLKDMLAWAELRDTLHFFNRGTMKALEWCLGFMLINIIPMFGLLAYYLLFNDKWHIGLLSGSVTYLCIFMAMVLPYPFWMGTQLNNTLNEQIGILTRHRSHIVRCEGYIAPDPEPGPQSPGRRPSGLTPADNKDRRPSGSKSPVDIADRRPSGVEEAGVSTHDLHLSQRIIDAVINDLRFDKENIVRLFGIELTTQRLISLGTAAYTVMFFAYGQVSSRLEKEFHDLLNNNSTDVARLLRL